MRAETSFVRWLGIVGCLVAATTCRKQATEEDDEARVGPRKVRCAPAAERALSDTIELRGSVAPLPDKDAQVSAQTAGRIARVLVREGDHVRAGQPIAQIDTTPLQDDAAEAQANVARARAERTNAETTLARVERVVERGIAARQELDDAVARAASAKAGETQAVAAARRASLHIERATVRSPMDGVVLKVMRRSGELTDGTAATAVVEIGDVSKVELVGDAPAQDLMRLARGAPATVSLTGIAGRTFPGTVSAVSPAVDRTTGLGVVRVALDISGGTPPPVGIFGVARIASGQPRRAVVIPAVALRNAAGPEAEVVICGADKVARVVHVKIGTGVHADELVEVVGGVKPGDQVAVAPVLGIADGDKLEPPEAKEKP
jgi:membrane fusion protein (multidrug efflux system)